MAKVEQLFLLILLSGLTGKEAKPAKYESVCSDFLVQFGDSLSDTGNAVVAFPMLAFQGRSPPYGSAFPGFPAGRYSNGRLIIDWLAGAFKLQTLEPYLRSLVPNIMLNSSSAVADTGNYRGGVCFSVALSTAESVVELKRSGTNTAIGKSTVLNPFTVDVQYQWFRSFKDLVSASSSSTGGLLPNLPNPKVFPEALYVTGEIGGNDYLLKFITGQNFSQVKAAVTAVVQKTVNLIEKLYMRDGARKFLVIGLTPQGCSPSFLTFFSGPKNKFNCLAHYNEIDQLHESEMRNSVHKLRKKLHDSIIIYADYYGAYLSVLNNAAQYGIKVTDRSCCGGGGPYNYNVTAPCGTPSAKACPNPQNYVYWDATHFTDSFNKIIAHKFTSGEFLDPPGTTLGCS